MKLKFLSVLLFLGTFQYSQAQYTETINSNRPGQSQGAFSVGNGVLQAEGGLRYGKDKHDLLETETGLWGLDYEVRYGLLMERLELNLSGSFLSSTQRYMVGGSEIENKYSNFEYNTFGGKYLLYDPHIKEVLEGPNLRSWKANNTFQWKHLIPAVSIYAGMNLVFDDNPYYAPGNGKVSPKIAAITQHNLGRWVIVTNLIADQLGTDFPSYSGILTVTHAINREWSVFGEYQAIKSDFYSDDLFRTGGAYLLNENFQLDALATFNFKDTPSRFQVALGVSYRWDMHAEDEYIMEDSEKEEMKKQEEEKEEEEEKAERQDGFGNGNNSPGSAPAPGSNNNTQP